MNFIFDSRPSDSPLVEYVWRTTSEYASSFISSASINWQMVIVKYRGELSLTVRGPETKATIADAPAGAEFWGITFKIGTFMPQFPAKMIMNRNDVMFPEASSRKFWLNGAAWQFPTYENMDTFINRLTQQDLLAHDPLVQTVLQGRKQTFSPRTIQRRFLQTTGLTLKTIQQIERAKNAMSLLERGVPILDTAFELGYFDQSHLTNSLKQLMGQTPAQILRLDQPE